MDDSFQTLLPLMFFRLDCSALKKTKGQVNYPPFRFAAKDQLRIYAFPASFNARSTFSGLSGSFLMRTPVALKIALAIHAMGGTQAISPAPLAP